MKQAPNNWNPLHTEDDTFAVYKADSQQLQLITCTSFSPPPTLQLQTAAEAVAIAGWLPTLLNYQTGWHAQCFRRWSPITWKRFDYADRIYGSTLLGVGIIIVTVIGHTN